MSGPLLIRQSRHTSTGDAIRKHSGRTEADVLSPVENSLKVGERVRLHVLQAAHHGCDGQILLA